MQRTFRKKPVEIQAVQLTREQFRAAADFIPGDQFGGGGTDEQGRTYLLIRTLEGTMRADEGDWIIRGVRGEYYPCKPDIFEATYEPVGEPAAEQPSGPQVVVDPTRNTVTPWA